MNLQMFSNPRFGEVRTIEVDGNVLFCGSDIAKALGYANPSKALSDHCKGVTKRYILTDGGKQEMSFIPEGDIYRLAARSKLPGADEFESWIFDEVLPSIRKTGGYQAKPMTTAQMFVMQAQVNLEQEQRLTALESRAERNEQTMQQAFSELTIPAAPRDHWQDAMCKKIRQLCMEHELNFQTFTGQLYKELDESAHVNIETRRKRLRERMKRGGAKSAECQAISKLAVVSQDPKLREIFSALVQRRAAALVSARVSVM